MQLEENTILITGGTSGIGLALAGLLQKQNTVIVCGRNPKHIEKTRGLYPRLHVWTCDLADSNSRARLAERVQREFPELNLLINNAGIQHTLDFTEPANHCALITEEITINLTAQIDLVDRLLPLLLSRPAAAVVNITSALALTPKQSAPVYCATKAAMRNFTRALRYQLENTSVSVLEVAPPLVETAMTESRSESKLSATAMAQAILRALRDEARETFVEKAGLLKLLNRLSPALAARQVRHS